MSAASPAAASPAAPDGRGRTRVRLLFEAVLIVVSVLLGFAATEWSERRREQALVEAALDNFRTEIAANLAYLETAQPLHAEIARRLGEAAGAATDGASLDVFLAQLSDEGLANEPLSAVAWETAETTGALRLLDYRTAAVLSETYMVQRTALRETLDRLADRFFTPANFDPAQRAPMVRVLQWLMQELAGQESYLIEQYREALELLADAD